MKKETSLPARSYTQAGGNLKKTLAKMKWWAKEKDRRYIKQKKLAEKVFGPLIKRLGLD